MVRIPPNGSSIRQANYAKRLWSGDGMDRAQIAREVGYSEAVARSPRQKIETKLGFHNEMVRLAKDSNELALSAIEEFKARGLKGFSNKDLVSALNAISNAWAKFNRVEKENKKPEKFNRLRTVVMQQVENQTVFEGEKIPRVIKKKGDYDPDLARGYYEHQEPGEGVIDLGF